MVDPQDRIISSLLKELLTGKGPPDVTQAVLSKLAERSATAPSGSLDETVDQLNDPSSALGVPGIEVPGLDGNDQAVPGPMAYLNPAALRDPASRAGDSHRPFAVAPAHSAADPQRNGVRAFAPPNRDRSDSHRNSRSTAQSRTILAAIFAVSAVVVVAFGVAVTYFAIEMSGIRDARDQIADQNPPWIVPGSEIGPALDQQQPRAVDATSRPEPEMPTAPPEFVLAPAPQRFDQPVLSAQQGAGEADPEQVVRPSGDVIPPPFARDPEVAALAAAGSHDLRSWAQAIDQQFMSLWQAHGIQPAAVIDDQAWVLRTYSRLLDAVPGPEELQRLTQTANQRGRAALIDQLVHGPDYRSRFVDHWSTILALRALGLSTHLKVDNEHFVNLKNYFARALTDNVPVDQMTYELISAVGASQPGASDFNPAVGLWILTAGRSGGDRGVWTTSLADTFLAQPIGYPGCDEVPSGADAHSKFWEFHAFFIQLRFEQLDEAAGHYRLANRDTPPEAHPNADVALVFESADQQQHQAFPAWQGTAAESRSGHVETFDRRTFIAGQIANSDSARHAWVDHVWSQLLGVPLSASRDDLPAIAEIQQAVSQEWITHGLQIDDLVAALMLTDIFARDVSAAQAAGQLDPRFGGVAWFNRYYHGYPSYRSPTGALAIVAQSYQMPEPDLTQMRGILAQRGPQISLDPGGNTVTVAESLPANLNHWAADNRTRKVLDELMTSELPAKRKVDHLFMLALRRLPSDVERQQTQQILEHAADELQAMKDIWWALLCSFEARLPVRGF